MLIITFIFYRHIPGKSQRCDPNYHTETDQDSSEISTVTIMKNRIQLFTNCP